MDLRQYRLTETQIERGFAFARHCRQFHYQPVVVSEELEVGEALNFVTNYGAGLHATNVWSTRDLGLNGAQTSERERFHRANAELRGVYEFFADAIAARLGAEFAHSSCAEIGCNAGLHLFNLARRGAASCRGYDAEDFHDIFAWLNEILGTKVQFERAVWDRLHHRLTPRDADEVDVMVSSVVMNHLVDILPHLAYVCDRARRGVFLWMRIAPGDGRSFEVTYGHANHLRPDAFPLCFDNEISISEPLLMRSLALLGFEAVEPLTPPIPADWWGDFLTQYRGYWARRTHDRRSAYWGGERAG
jgi:hypothetical protein